ncbi:MAG TPA: SDR family NAD(P)-dependent oxidoreductase [Chloroflexota bacterium]|nr:SDR family NAD(P)-dependent oxidoreductase [Chloroflexota bacterium]
MSGRFDGKVALVTGGANGLGRAIAHAFVDEGARVGILDLEKPATLADASRVIAIAGDVAHPGTASEAVAQLVERWGQVDILVNNAGAYPDAMVVDMTLDQWRRVLDVNVTGTFLCSQAFARHCLARGAADARIVNISSTSARSPRAAGAAYCASKAAIETFSKTLALELGPHHITVNVVAPGYIDVRGWSDRFPDRASDELRAALVRGIPLGEAGHPTDIAQAVLFLCSDAAHHITGAVLDVDGGAMAGRFNLPAPAGARPSDAQ